MKTEIFFAFLLIFAWSSTLLSADISGKIDDGTNPISGAVVEAWQGGSIVSSDSANAFGLYTLSGLGSGSYTLRAYASSFYARRIEEVAVSSSNINISLTSIPTLTGIPIDFQDFYDVNTTFLYNLPVQIGDVIVVADPDSVICGIFTVNTVGRYGFIHVYQDNPFTPGVDEGAVVGDTLTFYINNYLAIPGGPESPVWTGGLPRLVALSALSPDAPVYSAGSTEPDSGAANVIPGVNWNWILDWADAIDPDGQPVNDYYVQLDNDSDFSSPLSGMDGPIGSGTSNWEIPHTLQANETYYWRIRASEDGGSTWGPYSTTWKFTISNESPVIGSIGDKKVNEGELLHFMISASDPDGDSLSYSASNLPSGSTFDPSSRTFSWTPSYTQSGKYPNIYFQVSDGQLTDGESIKITVINVNRAPSLSPKGKKKVTQEELLEFTVSATDPDEDVLTYSASNLPDGAKFDASTATFSWTPDLTQSGDYTGVRFEVTDGELSDFEEITITVSLPSINIPLSEGWNIFSFNISPKDSAVDFVMSSIGGLYRQIRGLDDHGTELTHQPGSNFNTLNYLVPSQAYKIEMTQAATLTISGTPISPDIPIPLRGPKVQGTFGWNLIPFLPDNPISINTALGSIAGSYSYVKSFESGGKSYDPNLPGLSDLLVMKPGCGYWIAMTAPDTLVYPLSAPPPPAAKLSTIAKPADARWVGLEDRERASVLGKKAESNISDIDMTADVITTPRSIVIHGYGNLQVGDVVRCFDSDGTSAGMCVVKEPGQYGYMSVFGDDPLTPDVDEGAQAGDELVIFINDKPARPVGPDPAVWVANGWIARIDLASCVEFVDEHSDMNDPFVKDFYDHDSMVDFTWNGCERDDITYKIYVSLDNGEYVESWTVTRPEYTVSATAGHTYKIKVVTILAHANVTLEAESDQIKVVNAPPYDKPGVPDAIGIEYSDNPTSK